MRERWSGTGGRGQANQVGRRLLVPIPASFLAVNSAHSQARARGLPEHEPPVCRGGARCQRAAPSPRCEAGGINNSNGWAHAVACRGARQHQCSLSLWQAAGPSYSRQAAAGVTQHWPGGGHACRASMHGGGIAAAAARRSLCTREGPAAAPTVPAPPRMDPAGTCVCVVVCDASHGMHG